MAQRRDGIPVIVKPNGATDQLQRLALGEREISEGWLQDLLFNSPELLPINEIDPGFAPLVAIGKEVGTDAGPMDNLFISPQGLLTLVEAKLWRNPEARREVVGQMLDYAKELNRWSYEDLNQTTVERTGKSLWKLVSPLAGKALDEQRFVDAVSRNMRAGRFLLLLVGDGIREEMERLAEFLQSTPQLRFTLALIELQIYRFDNNGRLLVMPVVVGRTTEVTRAVVNVVSSEGAHVDVAIDIEEHHENQGKTRHNLTYDEFFHELTASGTSRRGMQAARRLHDEFDSDERFQIDWCVTGYSIKLRDPHERSQRYSILLVNCGGFACVGNLNWQLARVGLPKKLGEDFVCETAAIVGRKVGTKWTDTWDDGAPLDIISANYDTLKKRIEKLVTTIYRLRKAAEE